MIYFAYGSNMDETRMRKRCPSAQVMSIARLPGFRLAFTRFSTNNRCGAADIIPEAHGAIWGVVYQIKDEDRPFQLGKLRRQRIPRHKYCNKRRRAAG